MKNSSMSIDYGTYVKWVFFIQTEKKESVQNPSDAVQSNRKWME